MWTRSIKSFFFTFWSIFQLEKFSFLVQFFASFLFAFETLIAWSALQINLGAPFYKVCFQNKKNSSPKIIWVMKPDDQWLHVDLITGVEVSVDYFDFQILPLNAQLIITL